MLSLHLSIPILSILYLVPTILSILSICSKGNDAFNAKNYEEAIAHYSRAIELNPDSAVYYSNRSACHAALLNWQAALDDATTCVSKDSKFVKGYLRLVAAQVGLRYFDEAEATLKTVEGLEPGE